MYLQKYILDEKFIDLSTLRYRLLIHIIYSQLKNGKTPPPKKLYTIDFLLYF